MAEENKVVAPAPVKTEAKAEVKAVAKTEAAADAKTMNRPMGHGNFRGQGQGHGMGGNKFGGRNGGKFNRGGRRDMEFDEKVVKISRVAKTVKGGKRIRFSALVVIGDKKGKYGYGLGKSGEVPEAIKKAVTAARRNMFHLAIVKGDTIAHPVMGKFGATQVFLKPAPEGTGLVAGGAVRAILELAGVKNVYSKIYGSRTQTNAVKATVDGLGQLKDYKQIAFVRYGKKIEDKKPEAKPEEKPASDKE